MNKGLLFLWILPIEIKMCINISLSCIVICVQFIFLSWVKLPKKMLKLVYIITFLLLTVYLLPFCCPGVGCVNQCYTYHFLTTNIIIIVVLPTCVLFCNVFVYTKCKQWEVT